MYGLEKPPLPQGFEALLAQLLPEGERRQLLEILDLPSHRGLRLHKLPLEAVSGEIPGVYTPIPWARDGYYIEEASCSGKHPFHSGGAYYLQEPSAMAAVACLDVAPGQRVLDLCAAPGGKSGQIAARLAGQGVLVSNEPVESRARILSFTLERLGVVNACVTQESPERLALRFPGCFDRVLVDAPCSGEGMFRREPASRREWSLRHVLGCSQRQKGILEQACRMLRPGGILVYSTCTFNRHENEEVIADFLKLHPDFAPEAFSLPGIGEAQEGCLRLFPHRLAGEGHFVARLRRLGDQRAHPWPMARPAPKWPEEAVCRSFLREQIPGFAWEGQIVPWGTQAWLAPEDGPPLHGLRALREGLALGQAGKRYFQPAHALAMAMGQGQAASCYAMNLSEALAWLEGKSLPLAAPSGWTWMGYQGVSLGFGKGVDGVMKNHLPKGCIMG